MTDGAMIGLFGGLKDAARSARASVRSTSALMSKGSVVALRYEGTLGGAPGGKPLTLAYVGREGCAREFEVYFKPKGAGGAVAVGLSSPDGAPSASNGPRTAPPTTLFRGNLVEYALQRARIERETADADLVVHEVFPGATAHADDVLHFPMIEGFLPVASSLVNQVRRARSRGQRRLMREVLKKDAYESRVVTGPEAFETFRTKMYEPYVRERFGAWGFLDDPSWLRSLYDTKRGCVVFIAPRDRPREPVCGAILLDAGDGTLAYYRNGFMGGAKWPAALLAERTTALELAMMKHAMDGRFARINFGYTRAILSEGLLTHKRRLGCHFVPASYSPLCRVRVREGRRADVFAHGPIIATGPGGGSFSAVLGYDDDAQRLPKRAWRATLKGYRISMAEREVSRTPTSRPAPLTGAVVWSNAKGARASAPDGELAYREAAAETLDLVDGVEWRAD